MNQVLPLVALVSLLVVACGARGVVGVHLSGVPADATILRVSATLDGRPVVDLAEEHPATTRSFGLRFPAELQGELRVQVDALEEGRCTAGTGQAATRLAPGERSDVVVNLTTLPKPLCRLLLREDSIDGGHGAAQPLPTGNPCGPGCFDYPRGVTLSVHFSAQPGSYLAGVSGACEGMGACQVNLLQPSTLTASFATRRACGVQAGNLRGRFCWEHPHPSGFDINAVWGARPDDIWAVGHNGVMLHYDGRAFALQPPVTDQPLNAVFGASASDVWAVGEGVVLHFDGDTWSQPHDVQPLARGRLLTSVWAGDGEVWIVSNDGTILHQIDGVWSRVLAPGDLRDVRLRSVWRDARQLWIAGRSTVMDQYVPLLLRREHGDAEFKPVTTPPSGEFYQVYAATPTQVWVVGQIGRGVIYQWDGKDGLVERLPKGLAPMPFG